MFDGKFNTLIFRQRAEAIGLHCGVVNKDIFTTLMRNETVAFAGVEPLDLPLDSLIHVTAVTPCYEIKLKLV
jgi:hypothetical protein